MSEFRMPSLGADMEEGKVIEWYVKPGSVVSKGDIVALVETEKAAIEVEVFTDGVVEKLLVDEGEKVAVGTPLAVIGAGGQAPEVEAAAPEAAEAESVVAEAEAAAAAAMAETETAAVTAAEAAVAEPAAEAGVAEAPAEAGAPRVTASPIVRRLARELGIDLADVDGTGPGGRITRADVEGAAPREPVRRVSPRARRLAARHGVELDAVTGTGPDGTITGEDVEALLQRPAEAPSAPAGSAEIEDETAATAEAQAKAEAKQQAAAVQAERQAAMRTAIARLMARSKREIPHYYVGEHIDMEPALTWLEDENARRSVRERLLPAVLLLKASALAAKELPDLNGFWVDDAFQPSEGVHLGVAISLRQGGLIAPAILDAQDKSLDELMAALRDIVTRTRAGRLRASEMSAATLTVTNLGDQGVETVYGVIYAPQVALVGFGRIVPRPWAVDGLLGVRRVVSATLSADHRASDGHRGALMLSAIARHLQEPEAL